MWDLWCHDYGREVPFVWSRPWLVVDGRMRNSVSITGSSSRRPATPPIMRATSASASASESRSSAGAGLTCGSPTEEASGFVRKSWRLRVRRRWAALTEGQRQLLVLLMLLVLGSLLFLPAVLFVSTEVGKWVARAWFVWALAHHCVHRLRARRLRRAARLAPRFNGRLTWEVGRLPS